MSKNTLIIIGGIAVVAVILLGKSLLSGKREITQQPNDVVNVAGTNADQTETTQTEDGKSWYTPFTPAALTAATKDGKAVIFFHASWCPTCKAASEDFQTNIDQIPSDVTILKADYDTETELKKEFGVVMQDTFVQVDAEGNILATWNSGGEGIKTLLANLK